MGQNVNVLETVKTVHEITIIQLQYDMKSLLKERILLYDIS